MSTGYGWEGIRQVCATLLGARHVPERLWGGSVYTWGAIQVFDLYLYLLPSSGAIIITFIEHRTLSCRAAADKAVPVFILLHMEIDESFCVECWLWSRYMFSWSCSGPPGLSKTVKKKLIRDFQVQWKCPIWPPDYRGGMEGCVDLGHSAMQRRESNSQTIRSQVRRPNHYTTVPPSSEQVLSEVQL